MLDFCIKTMVHFSTSDLLIKLNSHLNLLYFQGAFVLKMSPGIGIY